MDRKPHFAQEYFAIFQGSSVEVSNQSESSRMPAIDFPPLDELSFLLVLYGSWRWHFIAFCFDGK